MRYCLDAESEDPKIKGTTWKTEEITEIINGNTYKISNNGDSILAGISFIKLIFLFGLEQYQKMKENIF